MNIPFKESKINISPLGSTYMSKNVKMTPSYDNKALNEVELSVKTGEAATF